MNCKHCGATVPADAVFCPSCGGKLTTAATPAKAVKEQLTPAAGPPSTIDPEDREATLWSGHFSKLAMVGEWILGALATVAVIIAGATFNFPAEAWTVAWIAIAVLWIALIGRLIYRQLSIRYTLTNQRLIHERGLLWRQTDRIEAIDIDDVTFSQGPVERMLGIGTIRIASSDRTTPEFNLIGIEDVRGVANLIDEARRKERRKRAVHIESI